MKLIDGFSRKYKIDSLIYYEESLYIDSALEREKQIKKWSRSKKIDLINTINPDWNDLSMGWFDESSKEN
jgi:putative endonuclease